MAASTEVSAYWIAAISGLSAILGALLTSVPTWLGWRAGRRREMARERRELRQAARLVLEELSDIQRTIDRTAKTMRLWSAERALPAYAWSEYGPLLASALSPEAWRLVASAYSAANEANWHVADLRRGREHSGVSYYVADIGAAEFSGADWLKAPHRAIWNAMAVVERDLEDTLGPNAGVYTYTGRVSADEIEREWPGQLRDE